MAGCIRFSGSRLDGGRTRNMSTSSEIGFLSFGIGKLMEMNTAGDGTHCKSCLRQDLH